MIKMRLSAALPVCIAAVYLVWCAAAWAGSGEDSVEGETAVRIQHGDQPRGVNVLPEKSVEILGPIWEDWPRGHDWARDLPGQPRTQIFTREPHEVVIRLPSGRTIRHVSKATFFNQRRGIVTDVSLMPHLGGLLRYQEAIDLLETVLEEWDAELREGSKEDLARWKTEGDLRPWPIARREGGAVLHGEDKAGISFRIRPTASGEGWFLAVDVGVGWEEVRRILDEDRRSNQAEPRDDKEE